MDRAPVDDRLSIAELTRDPYPIYKRLRAEAPVLRVTSIGRTLLTRAADTRYVKETPELFTAHDHDTPMERAFWSNTLMRKDGPDHAAERGAMAPAFAPRVIRDHWVPQYRQIAEDYVARLPRGEVVDLFPALAGPYAARGLAVLMGMEEASDDDMQEWSQALISGAGNYGWAEAPFARSDRANEGIHALLGSLQDRHRADPNPSAFSVMLNAENPIAEKQIYANIKIAIGGGINEPRDAILTAIYGLLSNPDQLARVKAENDWERAFEEAVRWVAPIQVSVRKVVEDTEIRGCRVVRGETLMTAQASANRDEEVYGEAEDFDVYREKKPHQAFGNGPHFCLGTHVARRAVAQVLLPVFFDRFPDASIPDDDAVTWEGFAFRGPTALPVRLQ